MTEISDLIKEIQELVMVLKTPLPSVLKDLEHYSIKEVAKVLNCAQSSVRTILKGHDIKVFTYNGITRVRRIHLEKFITTNTF